MKRRVNEDNKGIIGIPLKLIIVVIVAVIAIGILLNWLPKSHKGRLDKLVIKKDTNSDEEISDINTSYDENLIVTVLDSDDDPMEDIKVVITGCGLEDEFIPNMTNSEGEVIFNLSGIELESGCIIFEAENPRSNNKVSKSLVVVSR